MTLLAYVWTVDGFVVGADGLLTNGTTGKVESSERSKLIRLKGQHVELICGWAGVGKVGHFDVCRETMRVGELLSSERLGERYVEQFVKKLKSEFTERTEAAFRKHPTVVLFVGCADNRPQRWLWSVQPGVGPEKDKSQHCCLKVVSGENRSDSAATIEEGNDCLRRYLEDFKDPGKYGGQVQIEAVRCLSSPLGR